MSLEQVATMVGVVFSFPPSVVWSMTLPEAVAYLSTENSLFGDKGGSRSSLSRGQLSKTRAEARRRGYIG